jgi:TonB family protein
VNKKYCFISALLLSVATSAFAASCDSLVALKLPQTIITSAQQVAAGAFVPPGAAQDPGSRFNSKNLPAFCRVTATVKPAADSDIKIEVWMPLTGWNGRYRGVGNGGFAGYIDYPGLGTAIGSGYAVASTDTGHSGSPVDASWALGHPDKIVDFGWRAIHEMTVRAKAIIQAFYGEAPKHSYFTGCSNGGRQALMEAQRFPGDYDGIVSGAPANHWTRVFATFIYNIQAMQATPESYIGPDKIPAIGKAVLAACDAIDGVKDGILNDPRQCSFDPAVLLCKQGDSRDCLTGPQVNALKKIYAGPYSAQHKQLYFGFEPGGEEGPGGWVTWIGQGPGKDLQTLFATGFFTNMIKTPQPIDLKTIPAEDAVRTATEQQGQTFNAEDPNLKPFADRGGKLIMYHGWSDAALPPLGSIQYFESVENAVGTAKTRGFMRLFMAPGMQHCGGGPGANSFGQFGGPSDSQHDVQEALEQWVEKGSAPDKLIATKFADDDPKKSVRMTRPLCAWPQQVHYKGKGDTNDAANFDCVAPNGVGVGLGPGEIDGIGGGHGATLPNGVYRVTDPGVTPPRGLKIPEPEFSEYARKNQIQGVVILSVIVDSDGSVKYLKVLRSVEPTLDANAVESVKQWKFAPAMKDGHPVAVAMNIEISFNLYKKKN